MLGPLGRRTALLPKCPLEARLHACVLPLLGSEAQMLEHGPWTSGQRRAWFSRAAAAAAAVPLWQAGGRQARRAPRARRVAYPSFRLAAAVAHEYGAVSLLRMLRELRGCDARNIAGATTSGLMALYMTHPGSAHEEERGQGVVRVGRGGVGARFACPCAPPACRLMCRAAPAYDPQQGLFLPPRRLPRLPRLPSPSLESRIAHSSGRRATCWFFLSVVALALESRWNTV